MSASDSDTLLTAQERRGRTPGDLTDRRSEMIAIGAASTAGIFALIGAGVGAAFSLIGVLFTTRATGRQARQARLATVRQERKEAILKFLEIAQQVERLAEDRYFSRPMKNPEESTHRMWVLQKSLDLVAAWPLRNAAVNYADRLNKAVYDPLPTDMEIWEFLGQKREPFLEAARQQLDKPTLEGGQPSGGWRAHLPRRWNSPDSKTSLVYRPDEANLKTFLRRRRTLSEPLAPPDQQ